MGFFSNIIRSASKAASNAIVNDIVTNAINNNGSTSSNNNTTTNNKNYPIPEQFEMFPKYPGEMLSKPLKRNTSDYTRLTIEYKGEPSQEFISNILQNGFIKASDVRYEKLNTYIIIEDCYGTTKIVYHIKK